MDWQTQDQFHRVFKKDLSAKNKTKTYVKSNACAIVSHSGRSQVLRVSRSRFVGRKGCTLSWDRERYLILTVSDSNKHRLQDAVNSWQDSSAVQRGVWHSSPSITASNGPSNGPFKRLPQHTDFICICVSPRCSLWFCWLLTPTALVVWFLECSQKKRNGDPQMLHS